VTLVEILLSLALLMVCLMPVTTLIVDAARSTHGGQRRLVWELRTQRHQAELATTTYDALVSRSGAEFPIALGDPAEDEYRQLKSDLKEETRVVELSPGLALATTTLRWTDPATGGTKRQVIAKRLLARPTLSLEARAPFEGSARPDRALP
jgi:hypothetical protein